MHINDNKGNHRKLQKNKEYTYKITHISAAKCPFSVVLYANDPFFSYSLMKTLVILEKSQINRVYINKFTYISADCHNLSNFVLN